MFAVMTFDKDPSSLQDIPGGVLSWIQSAGGWAAFGVVLWLLVGYTRMRGEDRARIPSWQKGVFLLSFVVALAGYVLAGIFWITKQQTFQSWCLTIAGIGALLAAGLPFLAMFAALRFRRIWALTKLSFKEAIRRRVLYAFSFLLLVFLFASWFIPHKPEDQVRSYVAVVYWAMTRVLLVAAVIVVAFSIPNDIRHQTIHTIVTKPVERFEILLGRFLGFTALMTLVLLLVTSVSIIYVLRGVDPEAAAESLKAREPLYGELHFENTGDEQKGTNVGREWDYRSYITAPQPNQPPQFAVWNFPAASRSLGARKTVRCEFAFDIYRTTKGHENKGVSCEFEFQTANFDRSEKEKARYYEERRHRLEAPNHPTEAEIDDQLAEEFGYFEVPSKDVTDYHTLFVDVPAGLFRNAAQAPPSGLEGVPPLQVRVSVSRQSATQFVGMAKHDLYVRLDDPQSGNEKAAFAWNFYKGALGLWLRLCLVIGLAVALSTYLSGVITLLVVAMLYLSGGVIGYIEQIGQGTAPGGGPMEALVRLANRQVALVPLEEGAGKTTADVFDVGFRWFIRRVLDLIPDVGRYDLTDYVKEGFNIPAITLLYDSGALVLYLLPWIVLGYYLIEWREIAAP
ncbi:MAG TPA: hypothetical protein VH682_17450, partial [Gemmataceae bacterium]